MTGDGETSPRNNKKEKDATYEVPYVFLVERKKQRKKKMLKFSREHMAVIHSISKQPYKDGLFVFCLSVCLYVRLYVCLSNGLVVYRSELAS